MKLAVCLAENVEIVQNHNRKIKLRQRGVKAPNRKLDCGSYRSTVHYFLTYG